MKKIIIILVLLALLIRFLPVWPQYAVWTGEKLGYLTTWEKVVRAYEQKVRPVQY